MARYVTREELRGFAANMPISEQASLRKSMASRSLAGSTFLSHSSKDEDLVIGATKVLENHGATVYVDEIDPAMPPYTSEKTANLLKRRIAQTQRFVLLASPNSKESKWVPWELGIADGEKGLERIALFPASDSSDGWANWEYLGLYRRIAWGKMEGKADYLWMVLDEKRNEAVPLRAWLTGA
ncbi:MAG: toll/interleukin-1 receptor domain-containing protein [Sphingomonas sp.]|uniref:toll/interleukin-1 receptor domain-containing protein n=1 Tax=Sphingomonas sp. TaxID=28214 RepID=UPI001AD23BF0|nr:toll/interleukin-1 receptor domain-containing protein [Sphingomonas sp.]MBN8816529.1 toll/interleukin-1 receptor domain-containing protein [Sphingomonas sp.]